MVRFLLTISCHERSGLRVEPKLVTPVAILANVTDPDF